MRLILYTVTYIMCAKETVSLNWNFDIQVRICICMNELGGCVEQIECDKTEVLWEVALHVVREMNPGSQPWHLLIC